MELLALARQLKFRGYVLSKKARWLARDTYWQYETVRYASYGERHRYCFEPGRYRRSFLVRPSPEMQVESTIERRVFTLWTGENELTPNRQRSLEQMRTTIGFPIELVTADSLSRWIVDGYPLHPAYKYLSLVHRSDYLRAYLMHHHGGGYSDLKAPTSPWGGVFDHFADPTVWMVGYRERGAKDPARLPGRLGLDIRRNYAQLVGLGAFAFRPHTSLTAEWLREVERRLDYYLPQLSEFPGGSRGEVVGYPISWTRVLGGILHPLELKHLDHVRQDERVKPILSEYQ